MHTLPSEYTTILTSFARLFSKRVWQHAQLLLIGAILAPGQRTVAAVLRIVGLDTKPALPDVSSGSEPRRTGRVWKSATCCWPGWSRFLCLPVPSFWAWMTRSSAARGAKIKAKGIYRDPVRSSHSHFVKASGLRWLSLMLLTPIPWAKRVWALALPDSPGTFGAVL